MNPSQPKEPQLEGSRYLWYISVMKFYDSVTRWWFIYIIIHILIMMCTLQITPQQRTPYRKLLVKTSRPIEIPNTDNSGNVMQFRFVNSNVIAWSVENIYLESEDYYRLDFKKLNFSLDTWNLLLIPNSERKSVESRQPYIRMGQPVDILWTNDYA
ncbi:11319_t:CDS:2 [Acaulospora morrowiae]|uniref:11319_t:CDS:1 n=1 Tax=Acaulospora morrowiae TaxID=94023 RepID=A0A9N9B369_9GLOM|nr:11319_t:CDS:2 [Acaulospora morrowiae]